MTLEVPRYIHLAKYKNKMKNLKNQVFYIDLDDFKI